MQHQLFRRLTMMGLMIALVGQLMVLDLRGAWANNDDLRGQEQAGQQPTWMRDAMTKMERELIAKYGEGQRARIERGLKQVASFWRAEDGDASVFEDFVRTNFAGEQATLDTMFARFQHNMEKLDGHMGEIGREFRQQSDLDLGPILPFDEMFAGYDPSAHVIDDFFKNKIAFTVLLNFPLTTLQQKVAEGERWTRRQWAETRLAQRFAKRIPASVNLAIAEASSEADRYIAEYNIWMHHLLDEKGQRLFHRRCGCSHTGICATRLRLTTRMRRRAYRSNA
ncbi:MAG: hypothetical protein ICV68_06820 [Pyrinomonadaceae bacterium]|nr:hypothetical protein [Pyrinomonadaceae bacterium]